MGENDRYILLLEDDPDLAKMITRVLESDGHCVSHSENGQRALSRCDESLPALIVADLMLPVMDGEEFLSELRTRHSDAQSIPVLLVTASAIRETVAARAGVAASLAKPFDIDELKVLVEDLLATAA